MAEYQCTVLFDASAGVDVEADSPEEAANKAEDALTGVQNLCHQCSDALSTGDSIGVLVYQGDTLVAETGFHAEQLASVTAQRDELVRARLVLGAENIRLRARAPTTQAASDVLAERQRQIDSEGWTPEHDDEHTAGALALAAACYAGSSAGKWGVATAAWPWPPEWWKPGTPRQDLVKAGALILAEIERLDRVAAQKGGA